MYHSPKLSLQEYNEMICLNLFKLCYNELSFLLIRLPGKTYIHNGVLQELLVTLPSLDYDSLRYHVLTRIQLIVRDSIARIITTSVICINYFTTNGPILRLLLLLLLLLCWLSFLSLFRDCYLLQTLYLFRG